MQFVYVRFNIIIFIRRFYVYARVYRNTGHYSAPLKVNHISCHRRIQGEGQPPFSEKKAE